MLLFRFSDSVCSCRIKKSQKVCIVSCSDILFLSLDISFVIKIKSDTKPLNIEFLHARYVTEIVLLDIKGGPDEYDLCSDLMTN